MFVGDIIFSQNDHAEELFFIFDGLAIMFADVSEEVGMIPYVKKE